MNIVRETLNVWAGALSYPLASLPSLALGECKLERNDTGFPTGNTEKLANDFDHEAKHEFTFHNMTLEQIRAIRVAAWFGEFPDTNELNISLGNYLERLAAQLLDFQHREVVLKRPCMRPEENHYIRRVSALYDHNPSLWYRLGLKMSTDLLVAAYFVHHSLPPSLLGQEKVSLPELQGVKGIPLTEQHVHLNACMPFNVLWSQCSDSAILRERSATVLFDNGVNSRDMRPLILRAMAARLLVLRYLREWSNSSHAPQRARHPDFRTFLRNIRINYQYFLHHNALTLLDNLASGLESWRLALAEIHSQNQGFERGYRPLLNGFQNLLQTLRDVTYTPRDVNVQSSDPFAVLWPEVNSDCVAGTIEPYILFWGLTYIKGRQNEPDALFELLFWQMIRCKNLLYRQLTQQEGIPGLSYFSQFYSNMSRLRKPLSGRRIQIADSHLKQNGRVKKIELRIAPGNNTAETRTECLAMLKNYLALLEDSDNTSSARFALSVHFVKRWARKNVPNSPKPESYPERGDSFTQRDRRFRYYHYLHEVWSQMESLYAIMQSAPALSFFIRGIDMANRERSVPNWVLATVFREFRRRIQQTYLSSRSDYYPIRYTAHLGEEFEHPVTGLRHIYEGIRYFGYKEGDRIGHGIALGIDTDKWLESHPVAYVPVEEYLDDLSWEWLLYTLEEVPDEGDRIYVESELMNLSNLLYDSNGDNCEYHPINTPPNAAALTRFYQKRFRDEILLEQNILDRDENGLLHAAISGGARHFRRENGASEDANLLSAYFFCERLWNRTQQLGAKALDTKANHYPRRLRRMQEWMQSIIGREGYVVECCPSSNLLIGDLGSYAQHPAFHFAPPDKFPATKVSFSINADDPLTFNTTVQDELLHLHNAMRDELNIERGMADAWIRARCEEAWRSSFVFYFNHVSSAQTDAQKHWLLMRIAHNQMAPFPIPIPARILERIHSVAT